MSHLKKKYRIFYYINVIIEEGMSSSLEWYASNAVYMLILWSYILNLIYFTYCWVAYEFHTGVNEVLYFVLLMRLWKVTCN